MNKEDIEKNLEEAVAAAEVYELPQDVDEARPILEEALQATKDSKALMVAMGVVITDVVKVIEMVGTTNPDKLSPAESFIMYSKIAHDLQIFLAEAKKEGLV